MCEHEWQGKFDGSCPYGLAMFGDVTWPDPAKARSLNASMANDMASDGFWIVVSVLYSYVPFVIIVVALLRLGVRRGTQELKIIVLLAMTWLLNELILKQLIRQARPEVSCVMSCGMPSSHSAFALNVWTFFLVDLLWRLDCSAPRSSCLSAAELWRPSPWDVMAWDEVLLWVLVWSLVLLPVPASRVFLGDHSLQQVLVGGCVGAAMTACGWTIARVLQQRYNHRLGQDLLAYKGQSLLCHNMALPYADLLRRCHRQAARSGADSHTELSWYIEQISRCLREEPLNTPRRLRLEAAKSNLEGFMNRRTVHCRTQDLLRPPSTPLLNVPELSRDAAKPPAASDGAGSSTDPELAAREEAPPALGRSFEASPPASTATFPLEIAQGQAAPAPPAEGQAASSYSSPAARTSDEASGDFGPEDFVSLGSDAAAAVEASPLSEATATEEQTEDGANAESANP